MYIIDWYQILSKLKIKIIIIIRLYSPVRIVNKVLIFKQYDPKINKFESFKYAQSKLSPELPDQQVADTLLPIRKSHYATL